MDDDDPDRPRLLVSMGWIEATRNISLAAGGTLFTLVGMAANAGSDEIAVSPANMAPHVTHQQDRDALPARLAELRLKGLIREVRPGVFKIASGLWKVGVWDPDDKEFFPFPD